jgi:hypothetical protein
MDVRTLSAQPINQPHQSGAPESTAQRAASLLQQHTHPATGSLDNSSLVQSLRDLAEQDQALCTSVLCELEEQMASKGYSALDQARLRGDIQADPQLLQADESNAYQWSMRALQYLGGASQAASGVILAATTCPQSLGAGCVAGGLILAKGVDNMQAALRNDKTLSEELLREMLGNDSAATVANAALDLASGKILVIKTPTTASQLMKHTHTVLTDTATVVGAGGEVAKQHKPGYVAQ